ncbi:hypothetical protein [Stenotrophomonas sp.]|uniref:hypothetical protein n=1 Tax=Stenotrophomonas sp. TaxID=69392 RepID=UPI002899041E|nr:hypothetical protein [Stenotrophomonas sp.]
MNGIKRLASMKGTGTPIDDLEVVADECVQNIRAHYPAVPADYLTFLVEVGIGSIGPGGYMLYSGLLTPDEIYGETCEVSGVLFFGDDYQGWSTGFDLQTGVVVEVDPTGMSTDILAPSFEKFVLAKVESLQEGGACNE